MRLSVVICTRNRARLLDQALESLARMFVPEGTEWELLLVDNGSTDRTPAVVASWTGRLPIRSLIEPVVGKSHALNRAVEAATGEYLLFTDDDVVVDYGWMQAYCDAFRERPTAAVFGGPVLPLFASEPPDWLVRTFPRVAFAFAVQDLGPRAVRFTTATLPFGANMAVRTREHRGHRYDARLGPRPGAAAHGEETSLLRQLLAAGAEGWWVPAARVRHYIPPERQTTRYLREWYWHWGAYVALTEAPPPAGAWLFGRPLWLWRDVVAGELRYRLSRVFAAPEVWIEALKRASAARGRFARYGKR
jgi:glycosyltransferase involved in cell wall biosynthesis